MKKYFKISLVIILGFATCIYIYYRRTTKPFIVEVAPVKVGDINLSISSPGEIKSQEEAYLKFSSSGRIIYLPFKADAKVQKGTALISIDGTQIIKNLENSRLDKTRAENYADEIRETYEGDLNEGPGLYKLKQAEKAIEQSENQIKIYENALYNLTLYAPLDGTIIEINKKLGETVTLTDTSPVIKLADLNQLYFEALVDEEDIGDIHIGQDTKVELDSYPDKIIQGKVLNIEKTTTLDSLLNKVVKVKILLNGSPEIVLRLGLSGDAEIIKETANAVLIAPIEAVFSQDKKYYVYVFDGKKAIKREIMTGLENDDFVEILSNLSKGELLIIDKIEKVHNAKRITVKD